MSNERKFMRTITQTAPLSFHDALTALTNGECVGIRPGNNASFCTLFRYSVFHDREPSLFGWFAHIHDPAKPPEAVNTHIRAEQFLGEWFLVVVDHRDLPRHVNGLTNLSRNVDEQA